MASRSKRARRIAPIETATDFIRSQQDPSHLLKLWISDHIGWGVCSRKELYPDEFVVEYRGKLTSYCPEDDLYSFQFTFKGNTFWIDAQEDDGSLGRLLNDNHLEPNCKIKMVTYQDEPHLCVFAAKHIDIGEELRYNYGRGIDFPWRKKVPQVVSVQQLIKMDNDMKEYTEVIKESLSLDNPDTDRCLMAMLGLDQVKVVSTLLKTNPDMLLTLKKCKRYEGCEVVRKVASRLFDKFSRTCISKQQVKERPITASEKTNESLDISSTDKDTTFDEPVINRASIADDTSSNETRPSNTFVDNTGLPDDHATCMSEKKDQDSRFVNGETKITDAAFIPETSDVLSRSETESGNVCASDVREESSSACISVQETGEGMADMPSLRSSKEAMDLSISDHAQRSRSLDATLNYPTCTAVISSDIPLETEKNPFIESAKATPDFPLQNITKEASKKLSSRGCSMETSDDPCVHNNRTETVKKDSMKIAKDAKATEDLRAGYAVPTIVPTANSGAYVPVSYISDYASDSDSEYDCSDSEYDFGKALKQHVESSDECSDDDDQCYHKGIFSPKKVKQVAENIGKGGEDMLMITEKKTCEGESKKEKRDRQLLDEQKVDISQKTVYISEKLGVKEGCKQPVINHVNRASIADDTSSNETRPSNTFVDNTGLPDDHATCMSEKKDQDSRFVNGETKITDAAFIPETSDVLSRSATESGNVCATDLREESSSACISVKKNGEGMADMPSLRSSKEAMDLSISDHAQRSRSLDATLNYPTCTAVISSDIPLETEKNPFIELAKATPDFPLERIRKEASKILSSLGCSIETSDDPCVHNSRTETVKKDSMKIAKDAKATKDLRAGYAVPTIVPTANSGAYVPVSYISDYASDSDSEYDCSDSEYDFGKALKQHVESSDECSDDDDQCYHKGIFSPKKVKQVAENIGKGGEDMLMITEKKACEGESKKEKRDRQLLDEQKVDISQKTVYISEKLGVKEGCKQVYDKINYCTFCNLAIKSKISRHILNVHQDNPRVSSIRFLGKRSKERMVMLQLLANEGNFKHNAEVLKKGHGCIIVGRRSSFGQDQHQYKDFLPCEFCKKFILKSSLWLHHNNCSVKKFFSDNGLEKEDDSVTSSGMKNAVRRGRNLLHSALLDNEDQIVSKMFDRMNADEVKDVVFRDPLIRRHAALRMEALGNEADQKLGDIHRISQGARTLGRLVLEARKQLPCATMDMLLKPENFDLVISCTKSLAYGDKPALSLGRFMGNLIGHLIQVKTGKALRDNQEIKCLEASNFQKLYQSEWNFRINSIGVRQMNKLKRSKVKVIPFTEDLLKVTKHLKQSIQNEMKILLSSKDNHIAWSNLAKYTMCRLILFNKRRRAEVKDLKVEDYEKRPSWREDVTGDLALALTPADKLLAKRMDMVLSAGKSRKNVDVFILFPPDARAAVDLLIKTREDVGVPATNPYVFARLSADTPYSGNTELRLIVDNCPNLKDSKRITSTSLRRYVATVSQVLDMSEQELQMLATHLGHDAKTHKEFYRVSHSTIELSKVSQLLLAIENGKANQWKGKRLAEISVEELPEIEEVRPGEEVDSEAEDSVRTAEAGGTSTDEDNDQEPQTLPEKHEKRARRKQSLRKRWTDEERVVLVKVFARYLNGTMVSLHNTDILNSIKTYKCLESRTPAQIRTKLNNIKLGKSN